MATHSSVLAWRIPGTGEPGGLLSVGSQSQTRLKQLSSSSSSSIETIGLPWWLSSKESTCNAGNAGDATQMWVRSLGQEDPLEKEIATHSSILAWRIPWTEDPGRLQSTGSQRVGHN